MTYKVLVDVCVFQDVITKRKDWEGSQKVLKLFDREDNEGWISSLTKPIIYFLSVKKIGEKNARKLVEYYTAPFTGRNFGVKKKLWCQLWCQSLTGCCPNPNLMKISNPVKNCIQQNQ